MSTAHNHNHCITAAITNAEQICQQQGIRFTPLRRQVLELIWASHRPASAYNLLQRLRRQVPHAEPPTIYRTLDFLLVNGFAHKIESLNAFVGCVQPQHRHPGQFLICGDCNQVTELDDPELKQLIDSKAAGAGLKAAHHTVEITGLCRQCDA